jgi:Ulp1 family protease
MAVIDLKEKKIVYYDSLLGRENGCLQVSSSRVWTYSKLQELMILICHFLSPLALIQRLLNYLQDEYKEKNQQAKSFSDFSLQAPTVGCFSLDLAIPLLQGT